MMDLVGSPHYIAPEVLVSQYDEKCDLWSVGVLMYILLANIPPFDGRDENEIIKNVKAGIYELDIPEFDKVSPSAKSLVANLLQFESK